MRASNCFLPTTYYKPSDRDRGKEGVHVAFPSAVLWTVNSFFENTSLVDCL